MSNRFVCIGLGCSLCKRCEHSDAVGLVKSDGPICDAAYKCNVEADACDWFSEAGLTEAWFVEQVGRLGAEIQHLHEVRNGILDAHAQRFNPFHVGQDVWMVNPPYRAQPLEIGDGIWVPEQKNRVRILFTSPGEVYGSVISIKFSYAKFNRSGDVSKQVHVYDSYWDRGVKFYSERTF